LLGKVLEILFFVSVHNAEFVNRVAYERYTQILFDRMQLLEEMDRILVLIHSLSRKNSLIVKQILDNNMDTLMMNLTQKDSLDTRKCAILLKGMSFDPQNGEEVKLKLEYYSNLWQEFDSLEVPENLNSLFDIDLRFPKKYSLMQ
jgi:hypothetical protein